MIEISNVDLATYGVGIGMVLMSYAIGYQRALSEAVFTTGTVSGPKGVLMLGFWLLISAAGIFLYEHAMESARVSEKT